MPNRLLDGKEAQAPKPRKGRKGAVRVHADLPPELKTKMVEQCRREDLTFTALLQEIIEFYYDATERK